MVLSALSFGLKIPSRYSGHDTSASVFTRCKVLTVGREHLPALSTVPVAHPGWCSRPVTQYPLAGHGTWQQESALSLGVLLRFCPLGRTVVLSYSKAVTGEQLTPRGGPRQQLWGPGIRCSGPVLIVKAFFVKQELISVLDTRAPQCRAQGTFPELECSPLL